MQPDNRAGLIPHALLAGCAAALAAPALLAAPPAPVAPTVMNPPPQPKDWANLATLPDWSGVWTPNVSDQEKREKSDPIPWTPKAAAQVAHLEAEERAGRPRGLFVNCLPESMPSWMLITHNAMEFLFTPGRVTILGESDSNRLRRIYTDGRAHPPDPEPTFHGHSIGHWQGQTLVVDTVAVLPQTYIAPSEAVGVPNNGDLHIVERIHLAGPDILQDDLEITAPHVLTKTWKTSRFLLRQRARKYDIVEGVCLQGNYSAGTDAAGNAVFVPVPETEGGNWLPPAR
ncbi:MAG: hypothetical protein JSR67_09030 [Proteobacteria bacterium]|nr:hypothetical protein [Pseudomonadota bacterium]